MTIFSGDNAMVLKNIQTSLFASLKIFDFYCNTETTFEKNPKKLGSFAQKPVDVVGKL
jgi:hypothetical protein